MTLSHLDDDAVSAALDGEATAEEQSHLATCAACRARIERLRSVALLLSAPIPTRPVAAVDTAVNAAIDAAWSSERRGANAVGVEPAGVAGRDAASAGGSGVGTGRVRAGRGMRQLGGRRPGSGRYDRADGRPSRTWRTRRALVSAAVILAFLGGVGGLVSVLGRESKKTASTTSLGAQGPQSTPSPRLAAPSEQTAGQARGANPGNGAAAAPVTPLSRGPVERGPDLGAQSDPAAVARLVDNQLNAGGSVVPQAGSQTAGGFDAVPPPCAAQGAPAGQQATLVYFALVRWRGADALVLVYRDSTGARVGVVMRRADCTPLANLPV